MGNVKGLWMQINWNGTVMLYFRQRALWVIAIAVLVVLVACKQAGSGTSSVVVIDIAALSEGHSVETQWNGLPVIVYHRTATDIANLSALDGKVFSQDDKSKKLGKLRSQRPEFFVANMVSPYSSCKTKFVPIDTNPVVPSGKLWLGGFICPCDEIPYDLAGRSIKPGRYNLSGWSRPTAYLEIPLYHFEGTNLIVGKN